MKMSVLLSICIPSYNRSSYLPDLLRSIAEQYDKRVEVVICDNGSTDMTQEVASSWQRRYPWISYERFEKNVGPDRCFLRSVEMGSGTFCWLMGDDDIIEPGGLAVVLASLDEALTGITVNRAAYNVTLQKRWIEPSIGLSSDWIFDDASSCLLSLFPLFGFLSAQIVKRSSWIKILQEEDVTSYYNAYVLIYVIGRMIQKNAHWLYLHTPCVGWRSDNDSFAKELGALGRFALDITAYTSITKGLFMYHPRLRRKILNRICSIHFFGHVRKIKFSSSNALFLCLQHLMLIPSFWYKLLPFLLFPKKGLYLLRPLYRKLYRRQVEDIKMLS